MVGFILKYTTPSQSNDAVFHHVSQPSL